jgi:voltage-gated potassium channel
MKELKKNVYNALEISYSRQRGLSFLLNIGLSILIFLNVIAIILSTVHSISGAFHNFFINFVIFSVIIFSIEYVLRVWSCTENRKYAQPYFGRLKYIFSFWGIVDLLAILPFYITIFTTNFGFIRILRLLRILRLFRLSRYFHAIRVISNVLEKKKEELILSFSFIFFLMIIGSSLMYYIEHEAQPEVFSSIPQSLWWGVNTMTTVGYGDIVPITKLGKILGSFLGIAGISLFALPAGIIASGFNEHIRGFKNETGKVKCPYCHAEYFLAERSKHKH